MLAKDIMSKHVVTADPDLTLHELAELFNHHQITGVPVVEEQGLLVGVISQTDFVRHECESKPASEVPAYYRGEPPLPKGFQIEHPDFTRVKDCMTPIVISAREDDTVLDLAHMMLAQKIHRIVIMRHGKLSGIVTTVDLIQAMLKLLQNNHHSKKELHVQIPKWSGPAEKRR